MWVVYIYEYTQYFAAALPVASTIVIYTVTGRMVTFTGGGCVRLRSALRVSVPSHSVSHWASNVKLILLVLAGIVTILELTR